VAGIVTATDFPLLWGPDGPGITLASYMPGFGAPASAPGLALRALWNPATQAFSWNTAGSSTGTYVWNVLAGNEGGTGTGTITVEVHVPEPGSVVLAALALIGLVGIVGRRR
jgi:MYXO-CTERM domain-containing protein